MAFPHIKPTITFDDETGILTEEYTHNRKIRPSKQTKIVTNFERIKNMTEDEFAKWMYNLYEAVVDCDSRPRCEGCPNRFCCEFNTVEDWKKWLRSGVD